MNNEQAPLNNKEARLTLEAIRDHAKRYMEAVYGKSVWFSAPETFPNVLERWIWSVASDASDMAEKSIQRIEEMAKALQESQ